MVLEPDVLELEGSRRLAYSDRPARVDFDVLSGGIRNVGGQIAGRGKRESKRPAEVL